MKNRSGMTLIELVVVIGIIAVLLGLSTGPFLQWLKKGKVEDRASSLHETIKWAQIKAQKLGEVDVVNGVFKKQRIYMAVNQTSNSYKVVQWVDANNDNLKTDDEFTNLQEGFLTEARFGYLASVNKKACSNTAGAPADSVNNFTATVCPAIPRFTNFRCARFDGKGFMTESMQNASLYITNSVDSYAISLNPAGITTLCRWDGSSWQFIR